MQRQVYNAIAVDTEALRLCINFDTKTCNHGNAEVLNTQNHKPSQKQEQLQKPWEGVQQLALILFPSPSPTTPLPATPRPSQPGGDVTKLVGVQAENEALQQLVLDVAHNKQEAQRKVAGLQHKYGNLLSKV